MWNSEGVHLYQTHRRSMPNLQMSSLCWQSPPGHMALSPPLLLLSRLLCVAREHLTKQPFHTHIPHARNASVRGQICFSEQEATGTKTLSSKRCSYGFEMVWPPEFADTHDDKGWFLHRSPEQEAPHVSQVLLSCWRLCRGVVAWTVTTLP